MKVPRGARLAVAVSADVVVLAAGRPHLRALADGLSAPRSWVRSTGADAAALDLAGAALWLVAAWFGLGVLAVALSLAPGLLGRVGRRASGAVLPGAVRTLLVGATSAGVLLAPAAAHGAYGPLPPPSVPSSDAPAAPLPPPQLPLSGTVTSSGGAAQARSDQSVVVVAGDSLWRVAARSLGPEASAAAVAAQWPRWYAANRAVIGDDPGLIRPGQVLHAPDEAQR
jgi:nucleoid-associated protein YgaU